MKTICYVTSRMYKCISRESSKSCTALCMGTTFSCNDSVGSFKMSTLASIQRRLKKRTSKNKLEGLLSQMDGLLVLRGMLSDIECLWTTGTAKQVSSTAMLPTLAMSGRTILSWLEYILETSHEGMLHPTRMPMELLPQVRRLPVPCE